MPRPAFPAPPSAELHIHLEGTIEPEHIVEMARRNGVALPTEDLDALRARYSFTDLASFLELHYSNLTVLKTERDFFELATGYLDRAQKANVRRAEIFFDPQTHLGNGVALDTVMSGITRALGRSEETHGISTDLIMCFLRDLGADAADEMLTAILPWREHIIGVGLDSNEVGFGPELFVDVYARAAAEGLRLVAHAGEEGGPETVAATVELLKVERIDHGIRAMEDPEVVAMLRERRIPVTVCPLSNVALRAVDTMADHPLPAMLREGLVVTVSSDDPPYFGGDVDENYRALVEELGIDDAQLEQLALNSFDAAFITEEDRERWQAEVREHFAR
ncbi:adenosine deaminase [Rathayibacter sp. AY2B5]|uniref:adenosine deaminase n=1 Tax=Rathayibacter sp. AY2B5 TaxID=2080570 RepID=UPI000CE82089|nr:adenosine deaminase [Rathayibacter sp. AY2B5]PPG36675.1 adenosine deaminase [Rathayibacter sp. AY2B5]